MSAEGRFEMSERCSPDRRSFLRALAAAGTVGAWPRPAYAGNTAAQQAAAAAGGMRKSTLISMLPRDLTYEQRFALAREVGFEAIEMRTVEREEEAAEIREAAGKTGLRIHSVMNAAHWDYPLSSADPAVVRRSVQGMETSFRNAALWGADVVLLVPAVVNPETPYQEAWTRSQRVIRSELLPRAAEMKVIIGVEEVWNKFLLSPIEFAHYLDELDSPWAQAYFDVGNVVKYGYPQDWIRTLGRRIVRVHIKDFTFDRRNGRFAWVNLGEGDIDWPEVRRALGEVGYAGYVTTELSGGDRAYLADVSARVARILAGQALGARSPKPAA
jgi:L-ribulose-5-phosphate 3-epimerase